MLRTSARRPARMAPMAIAVAMCDLPTPGGPISSTPAWVSTKRAAGQFGDLRFRDLRIEGPVEVRERLHRDDAGLFQPAGEEPIGASRELVLDEQLEKVEMRQRGGFGLRHAPGQGLDHAGQPQMAQTGGELGIHRRKSSKVYWVIGRMAGSSVASVGAGRRRRAFDELPNGVIAKVLLRVGFGDGREHALAGMTSRQAEHALDQANGAHATRRERGLGPLLERRARRRSHWPTRRST